MTRPSARLQPVTAGAGVEPGDGNMSEYQKEDKIHKWPKAAKPSMALLLAFAFLSLMDKCRPSSAKGGARVGELEMVLELRRRDGCANNSDWPGRLNLTSPGEERGLYKRLITASRWRFGQAGLR